MSINKVPSGTWKYVEDQHEEELTSLKKRNKIKLSKVKISNQFLTELLELSATHNFPLVLQGVTIKEFKPECSDGIRENTTDVGDDPLEKVITLDYKQEADREIEEKKYPISKEKQILSKEIGPDPLDNVQDKRKPTSIGDGAGNLFPHLENGITL